MHKKYNLIEKLILQVIKIRLNKLYNLEKSLAKKKQFIKSTDNSPEKTWPLPEKIPLGGEVPFSLKNYNTIGKYLKSCLKQAALSIKNLAKNPTNPTTQITDNQLIALNLFAAKQGVKKIGFAKLPRKLIFKERAVKYENALVLIMEMDKSSIDKAPSLATFKEVFKTYDSLGIATNKIANYLRKQNFAVQASHPLGGLVLYPPLAQKANLGWLGTHGLLITPEFGARQRISAIFTNIENLPVGGENPHKWIGEFCEKCKKCVRTCPGKAIYSEPIRHNSGRETHIERAKCLPIFVENQGCTVCVKNCVFSHGNYYKIKEKYV